MLPGKCKSIVALATMTKVWVDLKWRISARVIDLGGWPRRCWKTSQKMATKVETDEQNADADSDRGDDGYGSISGRKEVMIVLIQWSKGARVLPMACQIGGSTRGGR